MNCFDNCGFWFANSSVFKGDNFAPSMVTDQPETIQQGKPSADRVENFSPNSPHAAKPGTPKQTPGYKEYIPVEDISPQSSDNSERSKSKSRNKQIVSGVVLTRIPQREPLNGPNIAGLSGAKPKRKTHAKNKSCGPKEAKVIRS
jgi:hypothetical protein